MKNGTVKSVIAALVLAGATAFGAFKSAAQTAGLLPYQDAQVVAAGKTLYADNCAGCHGPDLKGQGEWRSQNSEGKLPAPPHDETGHTWHHPDRQLFLITKFGTAQMVGGNYKTDMNGFSEQLSDDEIIATLAYIKSTWSARIIAAHNQRNEAAGL